MYSIFPALVALLFLGYGFYILLSKGASRVSLTFFALCFTTFMWQGTWAFLFETRDPRIATVLIKLGGNAPFLQGFQK